MNTFDTLPAEAWPLGGVIRRTEIDYPAIASALLAGHVVAMDAASKTKQSSVSNNLRRTYGLRVQTRISGGRLFVRRAP